MKRRFPWIRTETNFKRYLDLPPVSGKGWPSWPVFQPGWISQEGWNLVSDVFHGLWANHRLQSHFKPTDCSESQGGAKVWYLSFKSYHVCWNSDKRANSDLSGELDSSVCTHKCLSLDTDEQMSSGAYPAASWEDSVLWQRASCLAGLGAVHRRCGEALRKQCGTTARPSTTSLDLWQCQEAVLGRVAGPCQAPALLGWSAAWDVNAPSALCAGQHSLGVMTAGKKDQLFWGC